MMSAPQDPVEHINAITDVDALRRIAIGWMETALQHLRNEDYYRGLLDECAQHLGQDVYTQDDGGVVTYPLRAKIPECVARQAVRLRDALTACEVTEQVLAAKSVS